MPLARAAEPAKPDPLANAAPAERDARTSAAREFHVAPGGSDADPGTKDKPFATLERARDAARQAKGSTVVLAQGAYRLTNTFALDERDSGTTYTGKGARVTGSIALPNSVVKPVTDKAILERLLPEVHGEVMEIDLRALGITDFGDIGPRGFRRPYIPAPLEFFVDDEPLRMAQWPNPGQPGVPIGNVLDKGPVTRNGEKPTRGGTFGFNSERPSRWTKADDVWITGYFENGYADNTVKVKSFDLEKKTLTTVHPHMYGFASRAPWNRWVALNLLEEIDQPGEFMADKKTGKLYFLPPAGKEIAKCRLEASVMKAPLIAIEGAADVVFDNVNIECSRGMGVYIERGASNRIRNATLRNLGMVAVCIGKGVSPDPDYRHAFTGTPISRALGSWHEHIYDNPALDREAGIGHGIVNCKIYNIGAGAISLGGGDRLKLVPAGNFVENCEIHHFNRWDRTYKGAVNLDGVGNRVAHCKIHEAPALALYLHGNEHVIEFNEITRVMLEGDDMGALYMGRDPTERGNVIRYNYWHNLAPNNATWCLYFDDSGGDGTKIHGNVFFKAGSRGTVVVAGGSDFVITNNIFVDSKMHPRARHPIHWEIFRRKSGGLFTRRMALVKYNQPPWSERYPEFAGYLAAKRPRNNVLEKNLVTKQDDPRFVDGPRGNFALKPAADTGIEGFEPIPFERIGLKKGVQPKGSP
ncbi:MAG: right-handed parallel beta-helix repeat-containing protein [Kiritimatiellaeota bacterium]|nr:right-handed parallel beta-helix repeat-containing protein [Kiritimatiellota bacterium]